MRRSRIQVKPNIAKGAKQTATVKVEDVATVEAVPSASAIPDGTHETADNLPVQPENILDPPSESMRTLELDRPNEGLFVDVKPNNHHNHHVHFTDDVIDNEQNRGNETPISVQMSPSTGNNSQFATPHPPSRLITPRSRNVSMCEDESILQPKQPRDKRRFSGKEELDTKTWKMSDLTRWNPRNEHTSFKRERRSSTSSTIITKSEIGDPTIDPPRVNAPQVKIGADGRLVIDETSLVVQSAQINHDSVWETVEEGRMGSKITSLSFRSRIFRKPSLWTDRETDLFYEVLQCTGTDFGLMHHYLPQRSRPELKSKYNKEEKSNWERLLRVTSHPVRLDGSLEERIAKIMAEMEVEIQEKKERNEFQKAEEKRIRNELREQKATERVEEKMKKAEARELVKQAKELERGAKLAAKTNEKAEKEAKIRERIDARQMAIEAKRIATEARAIIRETRHKEGVKKEYDKKMRQEVDQDTLEREAERIIRRLIQETRREEREKKREQKQKRKDQLAAISALANEESAKVAPEAAGVTDPPAADAIEDTSSDSSTSATSSDEEALRVRDAKREKDRMKADRRNLEPRKSVAGKKPVYFDTTCGKYSQQNGEKTVELVKLADGKIFNTIGDISQVDEWPEVDDDMDTSSPGPAPPAPPAKPATSSPSIPTTSVVRSPPTHPEDQEIIVIDDEPIPQSVTDVVEEMARGRSKTPEDAKEIERKEEENEKTKRKKEVVEEESGEKKKEKKRKIKKEVTPVNVAEGEEEVHGSDDRSEEPPTKMLKFEPDYEIFTDMEVAETVDVETSFDETVPENAKERADNEVLVDNLGRRTSSEPSTSSAPEPLSTSSTPARRTMKKPVTWKKKH